MQLYDNQLRWYKGNLHTHTTVSDGSCTPQEVRRMYRDAGYDFLSLTDHNKVSVNEEKDGLLMLAGIEMALNFDSPRRVAYHFVGIDPDPEVANFSYQDFADDPQKVIDYLKQHGAYTILCHPDWSLMTTADILNLHGYDAVEVMNSVSDPTARGDSSRVLDTVMTSGRVSPMVASDDAHFYNGEHCHACVWVNAAELTHDCIMQALREGKFYASEGPRFHSIEVRDGKIRVATSPVCLIRFMSDTLYVPGRRCVIDTCANYAVYEIQSTDTYVRVEAVDRMGNRAWSQYIDVKNIR